LPSLSRCSIPPSPFYVALPSFASCV
jgi:hypothetical protein